LSWEFQVLLFLVRFNGLDDGKSLELSETEFSQAFKTVSQICEGLSAEATILLRKNNSSVSADASSSSSSNITGFTGHILIRRKSNGKIEDLEEVRIACVGNVDAGKELNVITVLNI
jgi:GTPase